MAVLPWWAHPTWNFWAQALPQSTVAHGHNFLHVDRRSMNPYKQTMKNGHCPFFTTRNCLAWSCFISQCPWSEYREEETLLRWKHRVSVTTDHESRSSSVQPLGASVSSMMVFLRVGIVICLLLGFQVRYTWLSLIVIKRQVWESSFSVEETDFWEAHSCQGHTEEEPQCRGISIWIRPWPAYRPGLSLGLYILFSTGPIVWIYY